MIKRMRVRNFKSLKDVQLELGLRNVLVGPNMAGKSNLIDVFRFLARMVLPAPGTYGLPNAFLSLGGFPELQWKGSDSNVISISLEGEIEQGPSLPAAGWKYELSVLGDPRGGIRVQEELLTVSRPEGVFQLIDKADGGRALKNSDGRTVSEVANWDRSALEFEIPDWQGNEFRRLVGSSRFYRLIPSLMKGVNQTVAANFLTETGDNLSSWLMTLQTRYADSFERITRVMRDVFADLESIFALPTQQATVFVASRERHLRHPVSVWQMSDGELTFLALLSLIFSPRELGAHFFCIEEPENHLHPRLLESLVEVLKQAQSELPSKNRAQILVTTHSPYLVDKFDLEELLVIEKKDGATVSTRPAGKAHLLDLLRREEAGLGELFYSGALGGA